jgi:dienelactone hydrolase
MRTVPIPWHRRIRIAPRILLLAIGLASSLGVATGRAGALVEFPNFSDQAPTKLLGYLAQPDAGLSALVGNHSVGAGPYPAVVVLHGCGGFSSHSAKIADQIGSWGYVALTVDSLGPRGIASHCGGGLFPDQAFDAYAALRYLSRLDFVDPARVAVLGQSMGGSAALYAIDRDLAAQYFDQRFRAAIAYYPGCGIPAANMTAPILILAGRPMTGTRRSSAAKWWCIHHRMARRSLSPFIARPIMVLTSACCSPVSVVSATGSNTMKRRPRMPKRRRAPSSRPISAGHRRANRKPRGE